MPNRETAVSASLPRDNDSQPIQVLSPFLNGTVQLLATSAADDSSALPSGTEVVRIAAADTIWLAFGGSSVDAATGQADSMLFPAGAEIFNLRDATYTWVAARAISGGSDVIVTATKME